MKRHQREIEDRYVLYNGVTEPVLSGVTAPIPVSMLPHESWVRRMFRAIGHFIAAIIHKINQLLTLILAVLLLTLFTRFLLQFFHLTQSLFSQWVFFVSQPLILPFNHIVPSLPYGVYSIDVSTLIAILIYALAITLVRQFLKVLVSPFVA